MATPPPFELDPALGALIRARFNKGDGSDGAFNSVGNVNYSAIAGVAADGNGVYVGNFTSFTLNDGHQLTLDQKRNLILCTGTVTLGGGTSGTIVGTGNGGNGGIVGFSGGNPCSGESGEGRSAGNGGQGQTVPPDIHEGGGGGGGSVAGGNGTVGNGVATGPQWGAGGRAQTWWDFFTSGDTDEIPHGSGGGAGHRDGGNVGSAGGDGGASMVIIADTVIFADGFAWTTTGSAGGAGPAGNSSGGGGGAGGPILIFARIIRMDAVAGVVLTSTGGAGVAGAGTGGNGGNGAEGLIRFLFTQYWEVGGTPSDQTALNNRTNPNTEVFFLPTYEPTRVGNDYIFAA